MSPSRVKLGIAIEDLRLPAREAVAQAARMGYQLIEIGTVGTEFDPRSFGETARRHLRRFVLDHNLEIAALEADIGGQRFADQARLDEAVDRTRAALEMAAQMHVPIVAAELGPVVPDPASTDLYEALRQLATVSDSTGTVLALRTGFTEPEGMLELLRQVGCATMRVCYDPAALVLGGFEPLDGIGPLADQIVLAYVRDAIPGHGSSSGGGRAPAGREAAFGEGKVHLGDYVAALHGAGYFGPLIVRRMHATDPVQELAQAREMMESLAA